MAAFCRQVLDCCRLFPLTWARMARETPCLGERKTTTASLLRKLTTASSGGDLEELPCAGSNKYVKEPERRTNLAQCVLEKQRSPVDQGSLELEKVTSSLLDMGFSDAHVNELLSIRPGANPQQLLDIISEFMLLGLNPEPVYAALKKSPQLLKLSIMQMKKRSIYLRKLGLEEGKLKRVLHCCPEVFTMHQRDIDDIVQVLKEKCLFTVQQVTSILHRCPFVLREEPRALEYKFQPCEKMLCCEAAPSPLCSAGKTACGLVQGVISEQLTEPSAVSPVNTSVPNTPQTTVLPSQTSSRSSTLHDVLDHGHFSDQRANGLHSWSSPGGARRINTLPLCDVSQVSLALPPSVCSLFIYCRNKVTCP
ncbi:transcription termination factor 4, mitochondrial isoform X2 [Lemur catta]|uniref:transcription termination factor 4, mitochondrial isoform X2 n=1 Tax=Lemur catta TaxID=9447 RepID=UPI001E26A3B4|nr:transcription termination factor 4, mitochondrial isoform X2 [Lemur catta]